MSQSATDDFGNSEADSDSLSADTADDTATVPAQYEKTDRAAYDSQQQVADAWAGMQWPAHNPHRGRISGDGHNPSHVETVKLYSSPNFAGYQHADGTGVLMHYQTREAVRTVTGLVLGNQQCWSQGFAHCSKPTYTDHTVPFGAVESAVDNDYDVLEITDVYGGSGMSIAVFRGGAAGVAYGRDPTATGEETHMAMRLSVEEVDRYRDNPDSVTELLTPETVRQSDLEVYGSDEYTKSRLDAEERTAHVENGGNLVESRSRWRDDRVNPNQYRADLRGNVIIRQGEWYFVPREGVDPTDDELRKGNDSSLVLGSHRPRRINGAAKVGDKWFVCGQISHTDGDHNAINLGDTWHEAVTHDREVLMYDTNPTAGGTRRWD